MADSTGTPGAQGSAPGAGKTAQAPKVGIMSTIQINLSGGAVQDIEKQVVNSTKTNYKSDWFKLPISEKGKDKLEAAFKKGDRVAVRNYIVAHMTTRYGKLTAAKEGELYQEGIEAFEVLLWKTALGLP